MTHNNQEHKIPILSFFSGGGFLDMGFEKAGFGIVFSNEIDLDFAQFYKEGMSSWSGTEREIAAKYCIQDLDILKLKNDINHPFGVIGGPPCQDFSIRGSKNGFDGIRGTMTYHFYEKIMDLQPTFFLMENVPGLVMLSKTKKAFNSILDLFSDEYLISVKMLNALHFGIPQNRTRLFVFGAKKDINNLSTLHSLGNEWFQWPQPKYPDAELSFDWGEPERKNFEIKSRVLPPPPDELCIERLLINDKEGKFIPNSKEFFQLYNLTKVQSIEEGDTYRPSFKRLHRRKFSPTVCYGNNEVHLHPVLDRRLSVRESLRIQGVPDSYILRTPGKLGKKFKMIGNGVPVQLSHQVAQSIAQFLQTIINC